MRSNFPAARSAERCLQESSDLLRRVSQGLARTEIQIRKTRKVLNESCRTFHKVHTEPPTAT